VTLVTLELLVDVVKKEMWYALNTVTINWWSYTAHYREILDHLDLMVTLALLDNW